MSDLLERLARLVRSWWRPGLAGESGAGSGVLLAATSGERGDPEPARSGAPGSGAPARPSGPASEPVLRCLLSIDDAGEYLVVTGSRVTIGHLRAASADLPFLADVGPLHAQLVRSASLREGPIWRIEPLGAEEVRVEGRAVGSEGWKLGDGDRVQLGENLVFRMQVPDPASETVLLELLGGIDCGGAHHVVLFGDGEGGRLRIGSAGQRHVRVADLEHEVSIVRAGDRLRVRCEAGIQGLPSPGAHEVLLPFPPPARVQLDVGRPREGRPPFGLAVGPTELPEARR